MKKQVEEGEFDTKISFEEQKQLYDHIDSTTFNEIWTFSWKIRSTPNSRDTLQSILWNHDGKYIRFLKEFSKDSDVVKNYYETYEKAGQISPLMISGLVIHFDKYDVSDIRMRLLIAIHYLTLNDDTKREEKVKINT